MAGVTSNPAIEYTPIGDDHVVDEGHERGDGHAQLEPERDVERDGDQEEDQRAQRLAADLVAPRRAHRREADVVGLRTW